MSLYRLFFPFSLLVCLYQTAFLSHPVCAFAPYLCFCLLKDSFRLTLWRCALIGIVQDLVCSSFFFGCSSLIFMGCVILLYKQKEWFFNDKIYSLSLLTFCFSCMYTFCIYMGYEIQKNPLDLCFPSFISEFLMMPLCDALYALFFFTAPDFLWQQLARKKVWN